MKWFISLGLWLVGIAHQFGRLLGKKEADRAANEEQQKRIDRANDARERIDPDELHDPYRRD